MTGPEPPDLLVEDLVLTGAGGRRLLEIPRLAVPAGGTLALQGPSGAGKSSLLHVLAGLIRPDRGRVAWGGTDLAALSDERRTRFRGDRIGLVFQDFLLFEELGSLDNAALAESFAPRAARATIRAGAKGWLGRLGLGADPERPVASRSGGERQRVAVARALARGAPVLLADEPTASLDRANADRLAEDLVRLGAGGGRTLVVATHDPALARRMGRVLTLAGGRVVEDTDA
ncbi:ABC transporter ATP-binding protein [Rubellimicrobium arenae]|uniref:ABC transporter ATP-binding protein n=1 Tax=Rubellimicrobium arenae TaxID=2817372 RepID=UPI001B300BA8|nr:ATP-binding cassette domain-containing protein [Rubellimicrobium arenae]